MKRVIAAMLLGLLLGISSTAVAATYELPWTKNIYNVSDPEKSFQPIVSLFDNNGNRCYVVASAGRNNSPNSVAISCVKK